MTEAEAQVRPSDTDVVPGDSAPEAPPAATAPTVDNALPEDRYLNRELSWLDFNARVLALAADTSLPLLERAKFLAIFSSNLDEFYMVRVAGLKRRDEMGLSVRSADGLSPREQLRRISERTQQIANRCAHVFLDSVRPALADEGILIVTWLELDDDERGRLSTYFHEQVFPVLTPLAVDPSHPFPFVSGLSLNLAITVKLPDDGGQHFARVKVPDNVDRFVELDSREGALRFLPMEELIAAFLPVLFPGLEIVEHHAFRITRNADFDVEEDRDEDLLQALERELARQAIRLAGASRGRRRHDREHVGAAVARARRESRRRHRGARAAGPVVAVADLRRRPAAVEGPAIRARHPARVRRTGDTEEHLRHVARRRCPRSPPVRLVLHHRAAVHRTGRRRPECAGDQADAVPHIGRLPDHQRAHRRRRGRQAGRRTCGDQGAVRRAGQHQVGTRTRAGGRARGVRTDRAEDALQDGAGGATGRLDDPALLPCRHRKLQSENRSAV